MKAEAHRQKAEQIERTLSKLQIEDDSVAMIEMAWGASIQWIAFGCETKYHQHQNNHTRLARFLQNLGEQEAANWWNSLDTLRQGGWYGGEPELSNVRDALTFLTNIRQWAKE